MVSQVACFIRRFTRHTARLSLSLMKVTQVTVTPNRLRVTPNRLSSPGTTGWLSTVLATGGGMNQLVEKLLAKTHSGSTKKYKKYPVLPYPTTSNHTLHRPTLQSPASLPCPSLSYSILHHPTPPYTVAYCHPNRVLHCFFCEATLYYLILPHLTTSYPVFPLSTPSYVVFYCHRTLDSTPSCLILPQLTTSYPVVPSYPSLHCHPTSQPTQSYSLLPHRTSSYLVLR